MEDKSFFGKKKRFSFDSDDNEYDLLSFRRPGYYPPEIKEMSLESIQTYFEKEKNPTLFRDSYANNILHLACSTNSPNREVIQFLLNKIDPNIQNIHGNTCFHYICQWKKEYHDLIMLCMQYKGNLNQLNNAEYHCLHYACYQPQANLALIEYLLNEKVNPKKKTRSGDNALHILCKGNQSEQAGKLFVEAGVKLDDQNTMGYTVFHLICAQQKPNMKLFNFLLEQNPNFLSLRNILNNTCFDVACGHTHLNVDVIMSLLIHGFDVDSINQQHCICLLQEKNFQLVSLMFLKGFDFEKVVIPENNPNTCFIHALCERKNAQSHFLQLFNEEILTVASLPKVFNKLPNNVKDAIETCHLMGKASAQFNMFWRIKPIRWYILKLSFKDNPVAVGLILSQFDEENVDQLLDNLFSKEALKNFHEHAERSKQCVVIKDLN